MVRLFDSSSSIILPQQEDPALQDCFDIKKEKAQSVRQVHFDTSNQVLLRSPQFDTIPGCELWYQPEDYQQFKHCNKEDSKQVARGAKSLENQAVLDLFNKCKEHQMDFDCDDSSLVSFLQNANNNGLTRVASKEIYQDKSIRRRQLYNIVKEIQMRQMESCEAEAELLRVASEQISQPSVMFAYCLARV